MNAQNIARFWRKVNLDGPPHPYDAALGKCHLWTGAKRANGYGHYRIGGRGGDMQRTHRIAFFLRYGRWPEPCGCHSCDVRLCCNADHIFEGTKADNLRDMRDKGRQAMGDKMPNTKLNAAKVREIRRRIAAGETQQGIADMLEVSQSLIAGIVHRRKWAHVDDSDAPM